MVHLLTLNTSLDAWFFSYVEYLNNSSHIYLSCPHNLLLQSSHRQSLLAANGNTSHDQDARNGSSSGNSVSSSSSSSSQPAVWGLSTETRQRPTYTEVEGVNNRTNKRRRTTYLCTRGATKRVCIPKRVGFGLIILIFEMVIFEVPMII